MTIRMSEELDITKTEEALMLNEETIEKLVAMRLRGMAKAFREELERPNHALSFEERFGMAVDREWTLRQERSLQRRLKAAKLKQQASMEDIDYQTPRGLDRSLMRSFATCQWIRAGHNMIIIGPTGVGKSFIACALANKACREGYKAFYIRTPQLFQELAIARADGSYFKLLNKLSKVDLLVIDDWGFSRLTAEERKDFLEVIEERNLKGSTLIATQLPIAKWYEYVGDPTIADAIMDRLVHNAYKLDLKGTSMRKRRLNLT